MSEDNISFAVGDIVQGLRTGLLYEVVGTAGEEDVITTWFPEEGGGRVGSLLTHEAAFRSNIDIKYIGRRYCLNEKCKLSHYGYRPQSVSEIRKGDRIVIKNREGVFNVIKKPNDINGAIKVLSCSDNTETCINFDRVDYILNVKGEHRMSDTEKAIVSKLDTVKDVVTKSAKDAGGAAMLGLKLAGVQRANDAVYNQIAGFLSNNFDVDREKFNNPKVKELIKFLVPLMMHPVAVALEGQVPYAKSAKAFSELAITESSMRNGGQAMDFIIELFKATDPTQLFTQVQDSNYDTMGVATLRKVARERGIRIGQMEKEELVDALYALDATEEQQTAIEEALLVDETQEVAKETVSVA